MPVYHSITVSTVWRPGTRPPHRRRRSGTSACSKKEDRRFAAWARRSIVDVEPPHIAVDAGRCLHIVITLGYIRVVSDDPGLWHSLVRRSACIWSCWVARCELGRRNRSSPLEWRTRRAEAQGRSGSTERHLLERQRRRRHRRHPVSVLQPHRDRRRARAVHRGRAGTRHPWFLAARYSARRRRPTSRTRHSVPARRPSRRSCPAEARIIRADRGRAPGTVCSRRPPRAVTKVTVGGVEAVIAAWVHAARRRSEFAVPPPASGTACRPGTGSRHHDRRQRRREAQRSRWSSTARFEEARGHQAFMPAIIFVLTGRYLFRVADLDQNGIADGGSRPEGHRGRQCRRSGCVRVRTHRPRPTPTHRSRWSFPPVPPSVLHRAGSNIPQGARAGSLDACQ